MGSPSPAAPPDHAAPPIQLLGNSLGRSPPPRYPKPPSRGLEPAQGIPTAMGTQIRVPFGDWGHSPSLLPPPLPTLLLPGEEFSLGKKKKIPPPANRTHDSTFLLAPVPLSLARGSPWPPQPHPLTWKSGSAASSSFSPLLGFSSFILEVGGWVLGVRDGRFTEGWAGED